MYPNFYSYSPQERQGYYEPDVKPNIGKNVQLQCPIPGQHSMEPKQGYFYPGGNHQVPGEDDQMAFDSNSNGELVILISTGMLA